ncbi:hypothetical protein Tco_0020380 [Tanacetum coccineum]
MSFSTISIPFYFTGESVRSLISLVILSDIEIEVMVVPTILPEIAPEVEAIMVASPTIVLDLILESALEAEPSKALLSPDYVPASPIHAPALPAYHPGSDTESEPFEDESEEPFEDGALDAAEPLPAQVVSAPPVQITPTLPTEPAYVPHVIPRKLSPSSSELSLSSSSKTSSSSSGTSHTPSGPLPRRRHQVSSYSVPSASVGPSCKRCRSPTTSLPAAASVLDATAEDTAEPIILHVYPGQTVEDRSNEPSEMIGGMYEHLLDMSLFRIEETEEELQALGPGWTGLAEMRHQVRDTAEQLQQCQVSWMYDREHIMRIEAYLRITMPTTRSGMTSYAIDQLITQCVAEAFANHEANRNNGNGNGNISKNRNGNRNETNDNAGGAVQATRGCTYKEFLNYQPHKFSGTKGVVGLTRWFKKIESKSHVKTAGIDAAYEMPWKELMKMVTEELALLCPKMVSDEEEKIERLQDAIKMANSLMDQKVRANAARQDENKRKWENNLRYNHVQQPPYKRQNVVRAYTTRANKKKVLASIY